MFMILRKLFDQKVASSGTSLKTKPVVMIINYNVKNQYLKDFKSKPTNFLK